MNLPTVVIALGLVGVGAYVYTTRTPADVYAMPVDAAYAKLVNVDFDPVAHGAEAQKIASGNDKDEVTWEHQGFFACKMKLRSMPNDTARTHVLVSCTGGVGAGAGVTASNVARMFRDKIVKRVDAKLRDIPYERGDLGNMGVMGWPDEGVDTYPVAS